MIMELSIILIAFKIILASGSSTNVHQTPTEIVIEMEQPSEIKCSHSIQDYNRILWYKQSKYSTQLQLLGYMNVKDGYPEKGVDVEMKGGALKDQTCILTLPKNNESAKYYCAASSTVSQRGRPHDKNIDSDYTKYDTILWYQRLNGDTALKLLGYMYYKIPNAEDAFTEAFSVSGDGERAAHLHISNLTTSDCGVYFGAARQATQSQEQRKRITKTSQMIPSFSTMTLINNMLFLCLTLLFRSGLSSTVIQPTINLFTDPGSSTRIDCSVEGRPMNSFYMYWYRQKVYGAKMELVCSEIEKKRENFQCLLDGAKNNFSVVISNLVPDDSGTFYCAASHSEAFNHITAQITLTHGLQLMKIHDNFHFSPRHTLSMCKTSHFYMFIFCPSAESDNEVKPPEVQVFVPSESERPRRREDPKAKTLVCVARGFYPDHVTVFWKVNGLDRTQGVSTDSAAQRKEKHYSISSRLRVKATDWNNPENCFNCTVQFYDGTGYKDYTDGVCGIKEKEEEEGGLTSLTREEYLKVTQTAKLSYVVFIVKGVVYGLFVAFLVWRIQRLNGKQT
ncbi:M1-specific T cell receptor beta chain-like [Eucyclogobius newberryi]|uniref:M1-specific T cell receptor beta chain-like n=1 Tax=Eucyclogobius newberryi TaxID=166745 RepID=UPI003B5CB636